MSDEPESRQEEETVRKQDNMASIDEKIKKLSYLVAGMFYMYTAIITLLRLFGSGRLAIGFVESYVYLRNGITVGGILFALLPVVIAFYSYKTGLNNKSRFYIQCFALAALLNHVGFLVHVLTNFAWIAMFSIKFVKTGPIIMGVISFFMFFLFICAHKLGRLTEKKYPCVNNDSIRVFVGVGICAMFLLLPSINATPANLIGSISKVFSEDVQVIAGDASTTLDSRAWSFQDSPDGKLFAFGCEANLTVLDAETLDMVFQDTSIKARAVRFSASGKYLAAVGEGISGDMSGIALYEVENGFKRLSDVAHYSSLGPKSKTFVRDVAFRPDERSMLFVYYDYWDKKDFSSREEWTELVLSSGGKGWSPVICEVETPSGRIIHKEILRREDEDILNSFRFSNDALILAYYHKFGEDHLNVWRNISFINTETWEEKLYLQEDNKYRMNALIIDSAKSGKIYFLYKHVYLVSTE
jgi:hypothetical protein